jgi:hypothetical protein
MTRLAGPVESLATSGAIGVVGVSAVADYDGVGAA